MRRSIRNGKGGSGVFLSPAGPPPQGGGAGDREPGAPSVPEHRGAGAPREWLAASKERFSRLCPWRRGTDGRHAFIDKGRAWFEKHPACERPRIRRCSACGFRCVVRCRSTKARTCNPCAESYRRRVHQVALSGMIVLGRGEQAFLTLTAPGTEEHRDTRTGEPCPCTPPGGIAPGIWNARLPKRWNRFCQALRRLHGYRFEYFRAIETQRRGALHEHVLIVSPDPSRRLVLDVNAIRPLAIAHGYGHSIRLERVSSIGGAGSYVAKYVAKSADERAEVPWVNEETGEVLRARYRTWSASRSWGLRMSAILDAQRRWAGERARSLDNKTQSYTGDVTQRSAFGAVTIKAEGG